jgi:hypothetical protein
MNENCEEKLRRVLYEEVGLEYDLQIGNAYRFVKIRGI